MCFGTYAARKRDIVPGRSGETAIELQPEQARLSLLGAVVFVPMPGANQLIGWLALGPRRSGEPYTNR